MNRILLVLLAAAVAVTIGAPQTHAGTGNGDGHNYNWLRDDDGDGIPNGLDEDWLRPLDGSGYQMKYGFGGPFDGLYLIAFDEGKLLRKQYRYRYDPSEDGGDRTRLRIHNRDGCIK
ncbi:MAG: hypothetical protein PVF33_11290 [Candidatus Latescibacterota bacterium]|jgi:hypothetical protein